MIQDSWITPEEAMRRLAAVGYAAGRRPGHVDYCKVGVSGRIAIHRNGLCDELAVFRLEDRGS